MVLIVFVLRPLRGFTRATQSSIGKQKGVVVRQFFPEDITLNGLRGKYL
jgi:hypothetical protein